MSTGQPVSPDLIQRLDEPVPDPIKFIQESLIKATRSETCFIVEGGENVWSWNQINKKEEFEWESHSYSKSKSALDGTSYISVVKKGNSGKNKFCKLMKKLHDKKNDKTAKNQETLNTIFYENKVNNLEFIQKSLLNLHETYNKPKDKMAVYKYDRDLNGIGLNNFAKTQGITGFLRKFIDPTKLKAFDGVLSNMIIIGPRFYTFNNHLEHLNLSSVNLMLKGTKSWWFGPVYHRKKMEKFMLEYIGEVCFCYHHTFFCL